MKETFDFYSPTNLKSYNLNESMRYQLNVLSTLDAFTRAHCERVAHLTTRLCERLHLPKHFIIYCTMCAYLHDIGKTFIPPSILQKTSRLTPEEYEVMKTHTTIGYKMCMQDPKLRPYAAGPLFHHEGLDGSGYPQGLTKKDIPLEGRIIRVADEYDAITSKRQYKSHIDISDTLQILASESKPNPEDPKAKIHNCGRIEPRIFKALLKLVREDIEYEITCVDSYTNYLAQQIKRLKEVQKLVGEMNTVDNERDRNEYLRVIRQSLEPKETLDNFTTVLEQYQEAYPIRQEKIKKLYQEMDKIKKLKY